MRFTDLFEEFILAGKAEGKSPNTLQNYRYDAKRFTDWLSQEGIEDDLSGFETRMFREFILHLQDQEYAAQTIRNTIAALRAIFRFGVLDDLIESDPMAKVDIPKVPEQEVDFFNDEEVYKMLQTCSRTREILDVRDKAIILLLYDTGIRASELVAIKEQDIDIENGRLVVNGKGSKIRVVPFSPNTARAVSAYQRLRDRLLGTSESHDPLFLSERRKEPLTRNGLAQIIRNRGKKVGLHAYPHKFRHSFAMAALRNGAREYDIQDILGHSTMAMTQRYAKNTPNTLRESHQRFSPSSKLPRK
ncbi:tyrosine-type recombinase/integrase [soil metagenome]